MAATDLSAEAIPACGFLTKRVTLNATAGTARELKPPTWARRFSITIMDGSAVVQSGGIASSGADDTAIGNDYAPITTGGLTWLVTKPGLKGPGGSVFLTATTASSYAHFMFEQE